MYEGDVAFEVIDLDLSESPETKTEIMVNLGNPDLAFQTSMLPSAGVGLARMEFIISESIRAPTRWPSSSPSGLWTTNSAGLIEEMTGGYASGAEYFVERLSEGVGTIAAAFYPRPVIVRLSDFKTNEYASLIGGRDSSQSRQTRCSASGEPRDTPPGLRSGFALECAAMKRARDVMGLTNIKLMIPFCRRVGEGRRVLEVMARMA